MTDRLSPTDPDRRLAERIGEALDDNAPLSEASDDPLMDVLARYADRPAPSVDPATSDALWAGITEETGLDAGPQISPSDTPPDRARTDRGAIRSSVFETAWVRRLAAALIVLAATATVWWVLQTPSESLVAEAQARIVTYDTPDGSIVRLRPHSRLYRTTDAAPHYRLEGEAAFAVSPQSAGTTFRVRAGAAQVDVLGTEFTVQAWSRDPVVFLREGRVRLTNTTSQTTQVLSPGQRGVVSNGEVQTEAASEDVYLDWLNGRIVFDERPAQDVANELGHHYGLRVVVPDSLARETLTGRILLDSQSQSLRDFGAVLGGSFAVSDDRAVFTRDSR